MGEWERKKEGRRDLILGVIIFALQLYLSLKSLWFRILDLARPLHHAKLRFATLYKFKKHECFSPSNKPKKRPKKR